MSDSVKQESVSAALQDAYTKALKIHESGEHDKFLATLPESIRSDIQDLGITRHNGRGVVITLTACKITLQTQDIRAHKANHDGGFNARTIDTEVVVTRLRSWNLANAGESHWLTQIFSGEPFSKKQVLRTTPKIVGQIVPRLVSNLNEESLRVLRDALIAMLLLLIVERDKSDIPLTRPKGLTIQKAVRLIEIHFSGNFKKGGPRLPQVAIYSVYECLLAESKRYDGHTLVPLERLKTANRKSGTAGDIDIQLGQRTVEAVEIKYGMQVTTRHVEEAIEKIKTADVIRYYILATGGIDPGEAAAIGKLVASFHQSNGCEIIVNGIFGSLSYYLRLLNSVDEFISKYASRLSTDPDVTYQHREAWNLACETAVQERLS